MIDLWPLLVPALLAAIAFQWRENHVLKIRVAVLENTVEGLEKTLGNIQKRQDSQSKKLDDIPVQISAMEKEVLKRMGDMSANVASLASDVKGLNNLILASDTGIKIHRE